MSAAVLLLILDLVLVAGAAIFLVLVIVRRGRIATMRGDGSLRVRAIACDLARELAAR